MNNHLKLKQSQKILLTPQLKQSVQLLNMSTVECDEWLTDALDRNPLLEQVAKVGVASLGSRKVTAAVSSSHHGSEDYDPWLYIEDEVDFRSYLMAQICEHPLTKEEAFAVGVLIESLDDYGYLTTSLDEIVDSLPLEWMLGDDDLLEALNALKRFDPAGVGAGDLVESLTLQLQRLPETNLTQISIIIVQKYLNDLSRVNASQKISKYLAENIEDVEAAITLISTLNPFPSNGFENEEPTQYIQPDVEVRLVGNRWQVEDGFFSELPIKINEEYASIALDNNNSEMLELLKEGQALIQQLQMRHQTIKMIAEYIVLHQQEFFDQGRIALKPMQMVEVADALSIHESTVSRAVNRKYINCPKGVFEMRSFFSQALTSSEGDGTEKSSIAVQALIEQYIQSENPAKPYSDENIVKWLSTHDVQIARRTVAKYRDILGIPAAFARKIRD